MVMKKEITRVAHFCRMWVVLAVCGLICGCASSSKASVDKAEHLKLPQTVTGNKFLQLLLSDIQAQGKSTELKHYVPSAMVAEVCAIESTTDGYVLAGNLSVDDTFEADVVRQGISVSPVSANLYTFRCPLSSLPALLQMRGVKRIELAGKVQKRKMQKILK